MKKFNEILEKIYGIMTSISFFGGIIPLIPFIVALIIGGTTGESIAVFLYKQFYPWVIAIGSLAIFVGLVHGYVESFLEKKAKKAEQES